MGNAVSSAVFCARRIGKAEKKSQEGQNGVALTNIFVATGQGTKVVKYVAQLDNKVGKTAKTAVDALQMASKNEKLLQYGGKALNLAAEYVNPLICISAGVDVLTSEDKESALIKNASGLGAMFAVEHVMKNHLDDIVKIKGIDKIAEKVMKWAKTFKGGEKGVPAVVHGLAFVLGSCTAYNIGNKFGTLVANKAKSE